MFLSYSTKLIFKQPFLYLLIIATFSLRVKNFYTISINSEISKEQI